ncbi:MAG: ATP-dependent helicase [Lachnospiraceae bacterium]
MNTFKSTLTPSQREAVSSVHGPVLCIAGPGSGKTLTIVQRLIYMIHKYNIEPTNILVVTFAKASAIEMRRRFINAVSNENSRVNFGTFHSIFFQILKKHFGFSNQNIINDETAFQIILSLLRKSDELLSSNPDIIRELLDEIAYVKSSRLSVSEFKSSVMSKSDFARIYQGYNETLSEMKLVDFEDMLIKTFGLLTEKPDILRYWQHKFQYILVDEFQDINAVQYEIIKMLAAPENNLFVVGDDDQAIYSFRGSSPAFIQNFSKDFPECTTITLDTNFRCTEEILKQSSKVISNNKIRLVKKLTAHNKGGSRVVIKGFADNYKEYTHLAKLISKELDEGVNPSAIAVLLRTNAQCGAIASRFVDADIPFHVKGSIPTIYDNRYLVPVIAYIRFLAGDTGRQNFLQFCNKPVRYISREALDNNEIDLCELADYYESAEKWYVSKNITQLIYDMNLMKNMNTSAAIHYIRKVMGYEDYLKSNLNLKNNFLEEIVEYLDQLEEDAAPFRSFTAFLEHIEEYRQKVAAAKEKAPVSAVNLVTYHGCKGLEYDCVYMPDCVEGITPHRLSTSPEELEEERRMFYVAMTRARKKLYLSYSSKRNGKECKTSRFINEILISNEKPEKGCRIYHETYKEGTVLAVEGDTLTIKFDKLLVPKKMDFKVCTEKNLLHILP